MEALDRQPPADSAPPPGGRHIPWLTEGGVGSPEAPPSPAASPAGPAPPAYVAAKASGHADRRELDGQRIKARLIDGFLVGIPLYLLAGALTPTEPGVTTFALGLALLLTYFFICESLTGQTLGKRSQPLRVMTTDYRPAQASAIAARTVLRVLEEPFLALLSLFASRERRQRIGDFAGRTIVARADECLERPPSSPLLVVYPVLWIGAVLALSAAIPSTSPSDRDRAAFETGLRASMVAEGAPAPVADCVVETSRETISDSDMLRIGAAAPYMATSGLGALDRPLRSRILEMSFQCVRRTGYLSGTSLPASPGQRKQYLKCIERHAQPIGMEACAARFGSGPSSAG